MKKIIFFMCIGFFSFGCHSTKKTTVQEKSTQVQTDKLLTGTYWKLTELMGQPATQPEAANREMHIKLTKEGNTVSGHGGCNSFRGSYTLGAGMQIKFSQMASTLMACPDMDKEKELMDVLSQTDNYAILGNVLSLNRARMAPLAKFEAVSNK